MPPIPEAPPAPQTPQESLDLIYGICRQVGLTADGHDAMAAAYSTVMLTLAKVDDLERRIAQLEKPKPPPKA